MPKGYVVAAIRVHDKDGYERFRVAAGEAIGAHSGRVLARDPRPERREGGLDGTIVVIEFDTPEAARRFYGSPEYTAARKLREAAAETDLLLVEGV